MLSVGNGMQFCCRNQQQKKKPRMSSWCSLFLPLLGFCVCVLFKGLLEGRGPNINSDTFLPFWEWKNINLEFCCIYSSGIFF